MFDKLDASIVQQNLNTQFIGQQIHIFQTLESTNSELRKFIHQNTPVGTVVMAEYQTGGKGRRKRKWIAPENSSLLFSVFLEPEILVEQSHVLTVLMTLAVVRMARRLANIELDIIWPNDVYYQGVKLCGVLTEGFLRGGMLSKAIIGCGLNVHQNGDALNLSDRQTTSLDVLTKRKNSRSIIAAILFNELEEIYYQFQNKGAEFIVQLWMQNCPMIGKQVGLQLKAKTIKGKMMGINECGHLKVKDANDEIHIFQDGEVVEVDHAALY